METVTATESRRHELYNGLTEILGANLTETLMEYLPTAPAADLATKDDLRKVEESILLLTHRFDQLQNILIAGFMSMIVTLIVVGFFG